MKLQTQDTMKQMKLHQDIRLLHLNIRILLPKMDFVHILVNECCCDIMVLTETWLTQRVSDTEFQSVMLLLSCYQRVLNILFWTSALDVETILQLLESIVSPPSANCEALEEITKLKVQCVRFRGI